MSDDEIVVLNEGYETRTSKTGRTRTVIKVTAEPIVVNFSKDAMGGPVAAAIAHHFRERIKGITALASPATIRARKVAAKAFAAGEAWAVKRYSGGKTGAMAPNQSDRAFNDSGRFASSITANASKDGAWRVNVAANRLSGEPAMVDRVYRKLVELVPEFGNPALLLENDVVRRAIESAHRNMIQVGRAAANSNAWKALAATMRVAKQFGSLVA